MKKQQTALEMCHIATVALRSLFSCSREWGLTSTLAERLVAAIPFAIIGGLIAYTQNVMAILLFGAVLIAVVVATTASDKWGTYLAEKLQKYLRELESVARQAAQVISNLPHIEKIRLSKIDFTSAILPIAPPPPRAHLAR